MVSFQATHIHLYSTDLDHAVEFYKGMFGAKVVRERTTVSGRTVFLDVNGLQLLISGGATTLMPASPEETHYGVDHFGFSAENLDEAVADLKGKGAKFYKELTTSPRGIRYAFIDAPDNVRIELTQR